MGSQFDSSATSGPFRVLILGGCYGGLSTALNLLDLSEGRAARQGSGVVPGHDGKIPIEVTIVDERDGFCMYIYLLYSDDHPSTSGSNTRMKSSQLLRALMLLTIHTIFLFSR